MANPTRENSAKAEGMIDESMMSWVISTIPQSHRRLLTQNGVPEVAGHWR